MKSNVGELEDLATQIIDALRMKVNEAAVKISRTDTVMIKAARGKLTVGQSFEDYEVNLYLAKDRKILVTSFGASSRSQILEKAVRMVDSLEPSPFYAELPTPTGKSGEVLDKRIVDSFEGGDYSILAQVLSPDEWGDLSGMAEMAVQTEALLLSNGTLLTSARTWFDGYARIFKGEVSGQWSWVSTRLDLDLSSQALEKARELAEICASLPKEYPPTGPSRLLLSPMVSGNLLEIVASSTLASSVLLGFSMFRQDEIGEKVAGDALTIRSTPLDEELPGYSTYDDEGIQTRNIDVIKDGILKTFLHNTKTARIMKAETTGNAGWVFPKLFNLEILTGSMRDGELMDALEDGVYLTNNWYTRLQNYLEGRFSTVLRDAVIHVSGGKPKSCIPGYKLRLEGSLRGLIAGVVEAGMTQNNIMWWEVGTPTKLPHLLIVARDDISLRKASDNHS